MTTTLLPSTNDFAPSDLDPLRLLTIAANLLPTEVTDARRGRKIHVAVIGVVVLALVLTVGWFVYAHQHTSSAQDKLDAAQLENSQLIHQQSSYAGLVQAQSASQQISGELKKLMSQDLQWWQLVPAIRSAAPAGITFTSIAGTINTGNGGAGVTTPIPGITSSEAVGTVTIVGIAPDKPTIAAYVDALQAVSGLSNPYLNSAQQQSGGKYQFTVQVEITSKALGGRFTTGSSSTGGH